MRQRAYGVLLAASAGLAAAGGASADELNAVYAVKLIGLSLGVATLSGAISPSSYRVEAGAKLSGVASLVSDSKGAATASGAITGGKIVSAGYATTSSNAQITRTIRIGMSGGNVKASEISPPYDETPQRVPVSEADKRNVLDPLSALVMPGAGSDAASGPSACNRKLPIYDGWTRFDVALHYAGARDVSTRGYAGPVFVCSARYTPISGHRADRPSTKFMADNKQMEVWLAPIGATHVFAPIKMVVGTMVGALTIEATEFRVEPAAAAAQR